MDNMPRKSISKKIRFEVFKRDNFTCQYCSSKPPKVSLEIDHLLPVCKRGTNHIDNLITACFDCNRGKGGVELTSIPQSVIEKSKIKKLALKQYKEYQNIISKEVAQINIDIDHVDLVFCKVFPGPPLTEKSRISVKTFIKKLDTETVVYAMEIACSKMETEYMCWKYFCGICWSKIKEREVFNE